MNISVAILAGGKSSRMGGKNKSFLSYHNQSFIERILLAFSDMDDILISVGKNMEDYRSLPYPLVQDEISDIGPLAGIHACLKRCQNEHLFVCATDMPGITSKLVAFMTELICADYDCFVLRSQHTVEPLCAIYTKRLIPLIDKLIEEKRYSPRAILDCAKVKYISLDHSPFDKSVVANINDISDFHQLNKDAE